MSEAASDRPERRGSPTLTELGHKCRACQNQAGWDRRSQGAAMYDFQIRSAQAEYLSIADFEQNMQACCQCMGDSPQR